MKYILQALSISLLFLGSSIKPCDTQSCGTQSCTTKSLYIPRSAGFNLATQMYRNLEYYDQCECKECKDGCFYSDLNLKLEYQRSFQNNRIAKNFFGTPYMHFVGSKVTGTRPDDALMADNFGLSPYTDATLNFSPRIKTYTADVQLFLGFDNWAKGLYLKLDVPISRADWDLRMGCSDCENYSSTNGSISCSGCCSIPEISTTPFGAGVMDEYGTLPKGSTVPAAQKVCEALSGNFTFGDMQTPWKYGRFACPCNTSNSTTKIANLFVDLGYNFLMCDDYHVGIFLRAGAPTGTKLDKCYAQNIFKPMVGQDHWMLGGGISTHSKLWNDCSDDRSLTVFFEGYLAHMFKRDQIRTFDLKNGPLSRYLLLKEFAQAEGATTYTYNDNMINAINWTTRCVEVDINVIGEAALDIMYQHCNWAVGVGYNIYGHSKEDISCIKGFADCSVANKTFGIKGCTPIQVPGFETEEDPSVLRDSETTKIYTPSSTESNATIYGCGTVDNAEKLELPSTDIARGFVYINQIRQDMSQAKENKPVSELSIASESSSTPLIVTQAGAVNNGTAAPVLLTDSDLDICSATCPRYLSHKIFTHVDYTWNDSCLTPYLQAGFEAEFGASNDYNVLNQWGLWIKGGLSY